MFRAIRFAAFAFAIAGLTAVSTARAQLIVGQENENEPVYYVDISTGAATPLFTPSNNGVDFAGIEGLDVDDAGRTIYFTTGLGSPLTETLYSANYDDPDPNNPGQLRVRKVADLSYAGTRPRVTGLAWDSVNNRLLTSYEFGASGVPEGIYSIDLNTGELTLLLDLSAQANDISFAGLGFNPNDGFLYATNLDFGNYFINRIDLTQPPASALTVLVNAAIPSNAEGLAMSNNDCGAAATVSCENRLYVVPDDSGNTITVFNLTTDSYDAGLALLSPFSFSTSSSGAGWGPNALSPTAGPNFCLVTSATPADGLDVELGSQITYNIRNQNCGNVTSLSGTYTMTLSGPGAVGATIDSVSSDSGQAMETIADVEVSGTVTNVFAGFQDNVTILVTPGSEGELTLTCTFNPNDVADAYAANNTEVLTHNVRVFPAVHTIFTSEPGYPTSTAPTIGGNFSSFVNYYRSPDGRYITFWADTDLASSDQALFLGDNDTYSAIVQEDVTDIGGGEIVDFPSTLSDTVATVNNSGQVAFSNNTNGSSSSDEIIAVYDSTGMTFNVVAREGDVIPALSPQTYSSDLEAPNITAAGTVGFMDDDFGGRLLLDNGAIAVMVADVTIPGNQAGGGMETWDNSDTDRFRTDAAGFSWMIQGDLNGSTTTDDVLVVDGDVVVQEGFGVTGLTGTIPSPSSSAGIISGKMESNGDWFLRGTTSDSDQDFLLKGRGTSYVVAEKWGDEIVSGSGEHWSDAEGWSRTFTSVAGNNQGDYIVTGRTDNPDLGRNSVAVLVRADGGRSVVLREGDPVDLDGNGMFDDNIWVRFFEEEDALLTDSGLAYLEVDITDQPPNPDSTGSSIGKAFVRLAVNATTPPAGADLRVAKRVTNPFLTAHDQQTTFIITICNFGPDAATNVNVTDTLPAGLDFVSATNGAIENPMGSGNIEATFASIAAFSCETIEVTVQPNSDGVFMNAASATANETDPDGSNNSASATVTVESQVDVGVTKIDNGGAPVGQNYDYTVTVTNAGPAPATNVVVSDSLPAEVTYVSCSLTDTNPDPGIVDVTIPTIPVGGQVVYTITVTADAQALVTNNISIVSVNEVDTNAANDTFSLDTINGDVSALTVTKTDSGLTRLGDDVTYTIDVSNGGPQTATGVVLTETLPAGVDLVSVSVPYNEVAPGVLEISYASIPNGGSEQFTVVVTPQAAGAYVNTVTVTANEVDPDDADNTAITVTRVGDFRDVQLIYSEISGDPTAVVPGALDAGGSPVFAEFDAISDIQVSPDGTQWMVEASSNLATTIDDMLIIGSGTVGTPLAQAGQPVPGSPDGEVWDFTDGDGGFNENNDLAWNARASGGLSSADDEKVMRRINGVDSIAFQQGDTLIGALTTNDVPAPNALVGNSISSVHLLNDNRIGYEVTPVTNVSSFYYPLLGYDLNVFLQSRADQIDGVNWDSFKFGQYFFTTPDGNHTLIVGDDEGSTLTDLICVYDGVVQLREGTPVGNLGNLADVFGIKLLANGDWFARGDDAANDDYAIRNGVVIAETGDSVLGGAETWGDTIVAVNGNTNGDYIVAGNTSEPDPDYDHVLVMNGDTLILREGDPIDLDGNGQFDDSVFISGFQPDNMFITNDMLLIGLVTLRNGEGTSIGDAFINVDLSVACPTIPGDVNGDGVGDGDDVQGAVTCILTNGASGGACACIDYNNNGMSDVGDIVDFVADLLDN